MKSPWKFLTQLTSRRREVETPRDNLVGNDGDDKVTEDKASAAGAPPENSPPASFALQPDEPVQSAQVVETAVRKPDLDVTSTAQPIDAAETPLEPMKHEVHSMTVASVPVTKGPRRYKSSNASPAPTGAKNDRINAAGAVATATDDVQSRQPSSTDHFLQDVARLDEEIRQLRIQSAQMLRLQNAQIKKMLERFD
jgi:hypothetical protein